MYISPEYHHHRLFLLILFPPPPPPPHHHPRRRSPPPPSPPPPAPAPPPFLQIFSILPNKVPPQHIKYSNICLGGTLFGRIEKICRTGRGARQCVN